MDFRLISNFSLRSDPSLQKETLEYFEKLKSDEFGWKLCADCLLSSQSMDESAVFFCLQVIENHIKIRYSTDSDENRIALRQFIFQWFASNGFSSNYILNKFAYIVNSVFLIDFPLQKWNSFFNDILAVCHNRKSCDLFLRILLQINADVADREIPRSQKEMERNTLIKDAMRETCLLELAQFWFNIINTYRDSSPSTVCLCLEVIGAYVAWIDISLITNDSIMSNLFNLFPIETFRCSVTDCFNGILHKGMDSLAKTQLIEQFMNVESIKVKLTEICSGSLMCNKTDSEDNCLFVVKFSKLMNTIGIELIEAYKKLKSKSCVNNSNVNGIPEEDVRAIAYISSSIESKFAILCQFLSHKNNSVSLQIHPFTREYIQWAKNTITKADNKTSNLDKTLEEKLLIFLRIIIEKCKYPIDHDFNLEEETNFDEFRKSCKVLFDNLMLLNSSIVINFVCTQLIEPVLMSWRANNYTFADIEIALYYFYMIGENLNIINDSKKMEALLQLLITSSVSTYTHSATQSIYFDLILRYEKFFANNLNYLVPQILISFLDERGFKNSSPRMRSKVAHLFNKFVKSQIKSKGNDKQQSFTEDILKRLQDFLKLDITREESENEMNGPMAAKTKALSIFDEIRYTITIDDQLHIYETASVLIISNQNFDTNKKQYLLKNLLIQPVWNRFEEICSKLSALITAQNGISLNKLNNSLNESDDSNKLIKQHCNQISHLISLASRTSKAFSNVQTVKSVGVQDIYLHSFNLFVKALALGLNEELLYIIQSSTRQFLHRLIVCLDESEIVPLLPAAIQSLFLVNQQLNAKTLQELVPLINQIVTKFKHSWLFQRDLTPFFKQIFSPLILSFFNIISLPTLNNDEKLALQKSYYTFLAVLVTNNIMDQFIELEVPIMQQILMTVFQGSVDFPDVNTQRICFQILRKFVEFYASAQQVNATEMKPIDKLKSLGSNEFIEFIYKSIIPACFVAPIRHNEDMQLVNECLICLKTVESTRGTQEFCTYLSSQLFPQHFPNYSNSNELIQALVDSDLKITKRAFKQFCQQFKQNEIT